MNRRTVIVSLGLAGFVLFAWFFHLVGDFYEEFLLPYATGMETVDPRELGFFLWHHVLGGAAALCLAIALAHTSWPDRAYAALERAAGRPRRYVMLAALAALVATLFVYFVLLRGAPLSVDDTAYLFAGKTLARGRLVNPSPGDIEFFQSGLIILDQQSWWSKYPIGHPLLLAIGELLHAPWLIVPLMTALCLVLAHALARALAGDTVAGAAALLLLTSPQFLFTGATSMSQPTSCACMLGAYLLTERALSTRSARQVLGAGVCLGFGIVVRPLPGLLFAAGVALYWLLRRSMPWKQRLRLLAVGALPILLFGGIFLAVNTVQSGHPLRTGYVAHQGSQGIADLTDGYEYMALSVGAALLRLSSWLLGWPGGLLLCVLAFQRRWALGWIFVAGQFVYRILAQKAGLSPTGPIYVYEIVPVLVIFTVLGVRRLADAARPELCDEVRRWLRAGVLGLCAANLCLFVPVQLQNLSRAALTWHEPYDQLRERGISRALVFANQMVAPGRGQSWATTPPPPSPDLDDDVLFVRYPTGADAADRAFDFWKRRFADRPAFLYMFRNGRPVLWEVKSALDFANPPWKR